MEYNKQRIQKLAGLIKEGFEPEAIDENGQPLEEMSPDQVAGVAGAATGAVGVMGAILGAVVSEYKKLKKEKPEADSKSVAIEALKSCLQTLSNQHGGV